MDPGLRVPAASVETGQLRLDATVDARRPQRPALPADPSRSERCPDPAPPAAVEALDVVFAEKSPDCISIEQSGWVRWMLGLRGQQDAPK